MKLSNEKKEAVYRYDLDCSQEEAAKLKAVAIERFAKDERAQLEYAVLVLLEEAIQLAEKQIDTKTSKNKKGNKNGTKNNNRK